MCRLAWPALLYALAACGTTTDDRPQDAQYLTDTILAPMCGQAECHSTFRQTDGVVLDTYEGMRSSVVSLDLVSLDDEPYDPGTPDQSFLIRVLTKVDPAPGVDRMPLDAPMANEDIELLKSWINGPATDANQACSKTVACAAIDAVCVIPDNQTAGECFFYNQPAKGAECNPSLFEGFACNHNQLMFCGDDWNFAGLAQDCQNGCELGICL